MPEASIRCRNRQIAFVVGTESAGGILQPTDKFACIQSETRFPELMPTSGKLSPYEGRRMRRSIEPVSKKIDD